MAKGDNEKPALNLHTCFDAFVKNEQLQETETWKCPRCKESKAPAKTFALWSCPDVLVLHLKRFQFVPGQYFVHRDKISDVVDFPVEGLDLGAYVLGPQFPEAPCLYDLYAVSQHMGGLGGGHYTAVCKNPDNSKW